MVPKTNKTMIIILHSYKTKQKESYILNQIEI